MFGSPFGEPTYRYYAEFEWADMDSFKAAAGRRSSPPRGRTRVAMGIPFTVHFASARGVTEPTHPRPRDPADYGFEAIVYEKAPPRATIRLNRPDVLNAFDFRMLREIARAAEDASWDDEVRVVVVTGTGRAFCVGADLRSWDEDYLGRPSDYWKWFGAFKDAHDRLREIGKPTIARINGIAVGGGNELQMACDLAVIVDTAFIRHVGLEHGSVPAGGATQWLQLMVGDRRAREIVFLCDEVPAAQAAEWGLVNRAVPEAELDAAVDEWVEKLSAKLPQTTRYAKQQLNVWRDLAWHQTVGHARDWLALSMLGDEAQGAVRAFLDRGRAGRSRLGPWPTRCSPRVTGAVLTITLNRPDTYNALNRAVHDGLREALAEAADPEVRAVVVTGAGRGFCSGQDLREFQELPGASARRSRRPTTRTSARSARSRSRSSPRSTAPRRGGLSVAGACDVRIASRTRPSCPGFVGIGLVPDAGGSWFLHRLLGFSRAFEWMVSNRRLSADEALVWGLVSEVAAGRPLRGSASRSSPSGTPTCRRARLR